MKERYLKRKINTNDTYTTPNNNQPIKNRKSHIFPSSQNAGEEESYRTCTAWNGPIIIELKWGQIFNMVSFVDCLRDWLTAWQSDRQTAFCCYCNPIDIIVVSVSVSVSVGVVVTVTVCFLYLIDIQCLFTIISI